MQAATNDDQASLPGAQGRLSRDDRKVSGVCTYSSGCRRPAGEDSVLCDHHRDRERERKSLSEARWRRRARRLGLCGYCPQRKAAKLEPGQRMCLPCKVRRRLLTPALQAADGLDRRRERAAAMTRKHADGRTRYHGQGKRGQQPRGQLDRQDLDDAIKRIAAAKEALAWLETDAAKQMPRIQLKGARDAALAEIALGRRTLDDVLERGAYKVPAAVAIEE